jgi:outer membrane protein assembly factor BamB
MRTTGWLVTLCVACVTPAGLADDWPQWGGPRRDGVWRETGIVDRLPAGGPKVLWRVRVDPGYSSPAIAGGRRLYVTDRQETKKVEVPDRSMPKEDIPGTERVRCLDAATGAVLWEQKYDCAYRISYPQGPRAMPLVHGGHVYTLGAMGDLRAWDAATGTAAWAVNFRQAFNCKRAPVWGWASSPVIDGDRLICLVGGQGSAVVAFHKDTGKELWRAQIKVKEKNAAGKETETWQPLSVQEIPGPGGSPEIGYVPPRMIDAGGRRQALVWTPEGVYGFDPATGKELWGIDYPVEGSPQRPEVAIAAPVLSGDQLLLSSFYQGALLLRLDAAKPGATVVWNAKAANLRKIDKGLHAGMCTPYIRDGYIYGVCGFGELRCVKLADATHVWETMKATGEKGLTVNAFLTPQGEQGDRCWIYNDKGDLILASLTPKGYEELSRVHLLDTTFQTMGRDVTWCVPAFANGCIFVRNDKELICASLAAG